MKSRHNYWALGPLTGWWQAVAWVLAGGTFCGTETRVVGAERRLRPMARGNEAGRLKGGSVEQWRAVR